MQRDGLLGDRGRGDAELRALDDADLVHDVVVVGIFRRRSHVDVANLILDVVFVVGGPRRGFRRGGGGGGIGEHFRRGVGLFSAEDRLRGGVKLRENQVGIAGGIHGWNDAILLIPIFLLLFGYFHGRRGPERALHLRPTGDRVRSAGQAPGDELRGSRALHRGSRREALDKHLGHLLNLLEALLTHPSRRLHRGALQLLRALLVRLLELVRPGRLRQGVFLLLSDPFPFSLERLR